MVDILVHGNPIQDNPLAIRKEFIRQMRRLGWKDHHYVVHVKERGVDNRTGRRMFDITFASSTWLAYRRNRWYHMAWTVANCMTATSEFLVSRIDYWGPLYLFGVRVTKGDKEIQQFYL